ncbi:MAG: hypothetical protein ACI9EK_001241 [Psychroserpens sp.]|jgi:hypothetical protein
MKINYQSTFCHTAKQNGLPPLDTHKLAGKAFKAPSKKFILCKGADGIATAIYGGIEWDFSPYSLPTDKFSPFSFEIDNKLTKSEKKALISEIKKIMFLLIYYSPENEKSSSSSVKTLSNRFHILRDLAVYCEDVKNEYFINKISLAGILSNELILAGFVSKLSDNKQSELSNLIADLQRLDRNFLGFEVVSYYQARPAAKQTPIIPSRIYFLSFERLTTEVSKYWEVKDKLRDLIKEFTSRPVGMKKSTQKSKCGIKNNFHPTLTELLQKHGITNLFSGAYALKDKRNLVNKLINIQFTCKNLIHLYTAMRNSEALHMKYMCVKPVDISYDMFTKDSKLQPKKFVDIVSTTTKYSGFRDEAGWLAPEAITKAIDVLKAITDGMGYIFKIDPKELPLFQNPSYLAFRKSKPYVPSNFQKITPICLSDIKITQSDRDELIQSDNNRNFTEDKFQVGQNWHFESHQYRRSLAFFGANSNLISESTGASLFKHLSLEMQKYYRKGFNKIRSALGCFNKETGEINIHSDHFLFEFRTGMTTEKAREIINIVLKDIGLMGKKGNYIERQRENLEEGEVNIIEIRSETERKVNQGEINYKKTLLGGCLKTEKCLQNMLGDFTACVGCEDAVIEPDKLDIQIEKLQKELKGYCNESAEYQLVSIELDKLISFRDREQKKRKNNGE